MDRASRDGCASGAGFKSLSYPDRGRVAKASGRSHIRAMPLFVVRCAESDLPDAVKHEPATVARTGTARHFSSYVLGGWIIVRRHMLGSKYHAYLRPATRIE